MTDRPQDDSPETPPPVDDTLESPPAEDDFFDGAAAAATPSRDDAARPDDETRPPPSPELARQATEAAEAACARILQLMGFDARVLSVPGDPIRIEIQGPDAGRVIGRHGTTLGALQYLVSRIVGHGVSRHVRIKVDVEGYRVRRENTLRQLARRAADRAVHERRTISLDPMPPDERRVVHMALADDEDVRTESSGDGDYRYVSIVPVRGGRPPSSEPDRPDPAPDDAEG